MKEKYVVSIYVAQCNEYRSSGVVYEGIYDVSEALEALNSLPKDKTPVIGLRIHKKGLNELTDIQTDILIGDIIHLEALAYIPEILQNEIAIEYIADLIVMLPEFETQGCIPDCLNEKIKLCEKKRQNQERIMKAQLLKTLSQLTIEAMEYSKSDNPTDQEYATALLKYAVLQKDAVMHGQKDIDLSEFPLKENFCAREEKHPQDAKMKEETNSDVASTVMNRQIKSGQSGKRISLLEKLYEYQKLIKQRTV